MATLIMRDTYRALEEEMKTIEKLKRETSARIKEAADHGDLKENAEYHAAREEQSLIVYKKQLMQSHAPFRFIEDGDIGISICNPIRKKSNVPSKSSSIEINGQISVRFQLNRLARPQDGYPKGKKPKGN